MRFKEQNLMKENISEVTEVVTICSAKHVFFMKSMIK